MESKTRRKIIEGTAQLLIEKGFSFISVDEISLRLGVSKKTLYNHFENKDAIYREAFRWDLKNIKSLFVDLFKQPFPDLNTEIKSAILLGYRQIEKRLTLVKEISLGKIPNSILNSYRQDLASLIYSIIKKLIAKSDELGALRKDISPEMIAHTCLAMIEGNLFYNFLPDDLNRMELFSNSIEILVEGTLK